MPLSVVLTMLQLQLAGLRRFGQLAWITVIQSVAYVGAISLVWMVHGGVNGALIALMISNALAIALIVQDLRSNAGLVLERPSPGDYRDVLDYGRNYHVARIGSTVDLQVGGLFLAALGTPVEIGLFTAATALLLRAFMISESIEASLLPPHRGGSGRPPAPGRPVCARFRGS
jgi:O-antigen/teichoic acid export membrane protein